MDDFESKVGEAMAAPQNQGEMADADPVQMYLNDLFTVTVNLAGLPGVAVPVGLDGQFFHAAPILL
jgi:Asp-tRNA(Asn)/Glu-tRNA(Gln) amidotransferase A subunit family amidase